jgi:hypothetical protein
MISRARYDGKTGTATQPLIHAHYDFTRVHNLLKILNTGIMLVFACLFLRVHHRCLFVCFVPLEHWRVG